MRSRLRLGRRLFLGGAAGAGLALGLPGSPRGIVTAQAQAAPQRIVFVTVGHSIYPGSEPGWVPSSTGALTTLPPLMAALEPWRERLSLVGGIDNFVAQLVSSNGHNASSRTLLTCMPHTAAVDANGDLIPNAPELDHTSDPAGPSIEFVMGEALGASPLILRVGEENGEHRRNFRLDLTEEPGEPNPSDAFDQLFGDLGNAPPVTPAERLRRRRTTILETVRQNYAALSQRAGSEDKLRLEQHAALIESVIEELENTVQVVCEDPTLELPSGMPSSFEDGEGRHDDVISQAQNSLIALTLACQATPIISLRYSTIQNNKFPFLNGGSDYITAGWHAVVHHDEGTDQERFDTMGWYHTALADLLTKLEGIPEGEGTLLDNTTVVFMSSLGNSAHSTNNLPVYIVAPPGGTLAGGQYVDLNGRSVADLFVTLMHHLGIDADSFGWNQGTAPNSGAPFNSGPIAELLA